MKTLVTLFGLGLGLCSAQAQNIGSVEKGMLTVYSIEAQNTTTSSGELYSKTKLSAAHKTLPMQSLVEVLNTENRKSIFVKINDRLSQNSESILKVSKAAAQQLGLKQDQNTNGQLRLIQLPNRLEGQSAISRSKANLRAIKASSKTPQTKSKPAKSIKKIRMSSEDYQAMREQRHAELIATKIPTQKFSSQTPYVVQLGAFADKSNANKSKFRAFALGILDETKLFISNNSDVNSASNTLVYRLQYGYFNKKDARNVLKQVKSEFPDAFLVAKRRTH
ncbi:MAG: RlpA-like double-psi beta-barrel domain-containing protein [Flavobacteriales bacterium]